MRGMRLFRIAGTALVLTTTVRIVVFALAGDLDPSFGNGGLVTTDFAGNIDGASDVALQPADGKIVAAGFAFLSGTDVDFALARYNSDGTLDTSFGTNGLVTTDFSQTPGGEGAFAVALQRDRKIVAAGDVVISLGPPDFALARYNDDGTLDSSFGTNGLVTTDFAGGSDIAFDVAVQPDGKIVTAGLAQIPGTGGDFALARYNSDGTLDTSFGINGLVTTDFSGSEDQARDAALLPDGKIVTAGLALNPGTGFVFALARYNSDGTLDTSFGVNGLVTTEFAGGSALAFAVALQPDRKIVAVGTFSSPGDDFALARYNSDGTLDTSFGTNGLVTTDFAGGNDQADGVALEPRGRIVAAGSASIPGQVFALARYNSDGTLDTSFGTNGLVTTDFAGKGGFAAAVALQRDGKIAAVGRAANDFGLARYLPR